MEKLSREERDLIKIRGGLKKIRVDQEGWVSGIYVSPSNPESIGMWLNMGHIDDVKAQYLDGWN